VVGKIIEAQGTRLGVEISDPTDLESGPVTVFVGGQFSRVSDESLRNLEAAKVGDTIYAFGYVTCPEGQDPRINARGFIVD